MDDRPEDERHDPRAVSARSRRTTTSSTIRSSRCSGSPFSRSPPSPSVGALGTLARYLLEAHLPAGVGQFPWTTLAVNLSGSLAIGFLVPLTESLSHRAPVLRPFLMVGFLGGWTTYSTLAVEATLLVKDGALAGCLAYLAATMAGGLGLVVLGHGLGRRMVLR